jgi:hypothetical protein
MERVMEWRFFIERTDHGEVTVKADTEEEARKLAREYARRVIHVNNQPWATAQYVREELIDIGGE